MTCIKYLIKKFIEKKIKLHQGTVKYKKYKKKTKQCAILKILTIKYVFGNS